jgi:hypothetical protein
VKEKVYSSNLHSLEELQDNIMHEISGISIQQHQGMSKNIFLQCRHAYKKRVVTSRLLLNYSGKADHELCYCLRREPCQLWEPLQR